MRITVTATILLAPLLARPAEIAHCQQPRIAAVQAITVSNDALLEVMGIAVLSDGEMIVADHLDYAIKRLDRKGRVVASAGGRGTEPGRFKGPGPVDSNDGWIAVADLAASRVQIFTARLVHYASFRAPGPVFDLCFDRCGNLWIGAYANSRERRLYKYSRGGALLQTVIPRNATGDRFADIFCLTLSPRGTIALAYFARNRIEIWDTTGVFIRDCALPGVPLQPPEEAISRGLFSTITAPRGRLVTDIAADRHGNIFVLGGDYCTRPGREIFVLDPAGRFITSFALPRVAQAIVFSRDGTLFAVHERTSITGYSVQWHQ